MTYMKSVHNRAPKLLTEYEALTDMGWAYKYGEYYAPWTICAILYLYSPTMCTTRPFLPDYDCLIGLMCYLDT